MLGTESYRGWQHEHVVQQYREAWQVVGAYEVASGATVMAARAVSDDVAIASLVGVLVPRTAIGGSTPPP